MIQSTSELVIYQSLPLKLQRCVFYSHASNVSSVNQAREVISIIDGSFGKDCSPFAYRVVVDGIMHEMYEDCSDFYSGKVLLQLLQNLDLTGVVVIASKKVYGMFVTDMIQQPKLVAVKKSAQDAIQQLIDARIADEPSKPESISSMHTSSSYQHVSFQEEMRANAEHPSSLPKKEFFPKTVVNMDLFGEVAVKPKRVRRILPRR